ncbi:hypothetical protein ACTFIZ_011990 [Dictyostelium cf. discoideum]
MFTINNIEFSINDVLLNQESLQKKNKYTCSICFEFIFKKSVYQCRSGHFACQECWEKSLEIKKECMTCRVNVKSLKDLSRCLVIEQDFGKKECCCIYSYNDEIFDARTVGKKFKRNLIKDEENGCKELLKVKDLENHIQNCKFKFIICPNKGCNKIIRLNTLGEHENECTFKLVTCENCKKNDIKKDQIENHHNNECPKVKIDCLQECQIKIERDEMGNHIEDHCDNTIVNCKYHEQGCQFKMKRSELQDHLKNVNHQFYMSELIDKLISELDQSNKASIELKNKLKLQLNPLVYKSKWTISNFSLYRKTSEEPQRILSPKFSFFSHEFRFVLYPHGYNNGNYPSLYLYINNINGNSIKAECSFTLINVLDDYKSLEYFNEKVFEKSIGRGFKKFGVHSNLINKKNGWLSDDDKLTIEIYIKILDQTFPTLES